LDDPTDRKPSDVVSELDRHIVGQHDAKRAVAIALRNRWRRRQLPDSLRDEVIPKNILMIGPTGCGKTEIARRLAAMSGAPFIKVEATRFTEVGFHGRDVDSIIRDLMEAGIALTKKQKRAQLLPEIEKRVDSRILDALTGKHSREDTRKSFDRFLKSGELEGREVEIDVPVGGQGNNGNAIAIDPSQGAINLGDIIGKIGRAVHGKKNGEATCHSC